MVTEVKDDGGNGGGNGGGGHSGGSGGGGGSTVTIGDNEVPLAPEAPLTDETIIEDGPVPLAVLPKTGDETPIIPAVVTLLGQRSDSPLDGSFPSNKKRRAVGFECPFP